MSTSTWCRFTVVASILTFAASTSNAQLKEDADDEFSSLLQKPLLVSSNTQNTPSKQDGSWPIFVPLVRESVPIMRNNKVVAHKTSYAGAIKVGRPAVEFRVVFDTGSGHVVLPAATCRSESCLVHKRYNLTASAGAQAINVDGSLVDPEDLGDQVTIGYGTGEVTGEFARDQICLGAESEACVDVSIVMAVEMTTQPFKSFNFDGIFGLSLDTLAVSPEFSFFNRLAGSKIGAALQFGFYLAGADSTEGSGSEIALGGYNKRRVLTPLQWAPVTQASSGYWQVKIIAVRIGNVTLVICQDGSCTGVVDTGTSHLGVPGKRIAEFAGPLAAEATEGTDCRHVQAPDLELVLEGMTLTLSPQNYMRPLPLQRGVALVPGITNQKQGAAATVNSASVVGDALACSAKLMPVNLAGTFGQNMFILGEPLLHRYYTVYDWETRSIGFGLSDIQQNRDALVADGAIHQEDAEDVFSFMQVTLTVAVRVRPRRGALAVAAGCDGGSFGTEALAALEAPALRL